MPFTGNTYTRPDNSFTNPVEDTAIDPTDADAFFDDLETALSACALLSILSSTGTFTLSGIISPSQITANQNDYSPTGLSTATVLRLNSDASRDITGIAAQGSGRVLVITNVGSNNIVLKDESVSSAEANRFALSADITLAANQSTRVWYDTTASRWRSI